MKLNRVIIRNFRSIREVELKLSPSCRVLVGINESGKTNILKALSLLSNQIKPSKKDVREPLPDEPHIKTSEVFFVFALDETECESAYKKGILKILMSDFSKPTVKLDDNQLTLEEFCASIHEGLYTVDIINEIKSSKYWALRDKYELLGNWKKPSKTCPSNYTISVNGILVPIVNYALIDIQAIQGVPLGYLEDATIDDINHIFGSEVANIIASKLPETIFWDYDEKKLLPPKINISEFAANPEMCIPLKCMFHLADIEDIKTTITEARNSNKMAFPNLLRRVAKLTTEHFQDVWKEYKSITFDLAPNGDHIDASIRDKFNCYELSQRSDGFKRFVTFLLLVSAKVKSNILNNAVLLVDEPNAGLHPSGERFLRDELIRISKNNCVVYSTHSIFMIDRETIRRHLIVKKEGEITNMAEVNESNIMDEEVIYNALGYSIFDSLKEKNIIFEGWRDKRLFKIALESPSSQYAELKKSYNRLGLCHARGVKHIKYITSVLELANRKYTILSDNDIPAQRMQKEYKADKFSGMWNRYDEILPKCVAVTGEDFVKSEAFIQAVKAIKQNYPKMPEISESELSDSKGKISGISKWLDKLGYEEPENEMILTEIKEYVFDNLEPSQINSEYYEYLTNLIKFLKQV